MTFVQRSSVAIFLLSFFCYFFVWLGLYSINQNKVLIQSEDTIPATYLPISILNNKGFILTDYYEFFIKNWPNPENKLGKPYYLFRDSANKWEFISAFPVITPILATPFFLPISILNIPYSSSFVPIIGRISASFFVALSCVFVFLLLFKVTKNYKVSILATISYAFGSICWGTTSQSLWQHGINQFLLSLGFCLLVNNKSISALPFSLAVFNRPTNIVFAVWSFVYILIKDKKSLIPFILWSLPPLFFQLWYDTTYLGGLLNHPYSVQQFTNWQGRFPEGILGLLISPSKGLFVLSPVFIFSLLGMCSVIKRKGYFEYKALVLTLLAFFLIMGKWIHWYGGWSFGYRMVSESLPFLAIFLGLSLETHLIKPRVKKIFLTLLVFSIAIQLTSLVFDFRYWHASFDNGPYNTSWLWSVKDSMLVYFAKLALIKLNILL